MKNNNIIQIQLLAKIIAIRTKDTNMGKGRWYEENDRKTNSLPETWVG